jgi:hypothetical protein
MSAVNGNNGLSDADIQMFGYYGIDLPLLLTAGVCRVDDGEARNIYGIVWRDLSVNVGGILFPYHHPLTGERVSCRSRPDVSPLDNDGNLVKYLSPPYRKERRHLYFPPDAGPLLGDLTAPVVLVESEKSVLACTAAAWRTKRHYLFVGTGGCNGWKGRVGHKLKPDGTNGEERGPLPDFNYLELTNREVIILFDSDTSDNPDVRGARRRLAIFLNDCGAIVKIAELDGAFHSPEGQ